LSRSERWSATTRWVLPSGGTKTRTVSTDGAYVNV
jgi:hypothetical protein